MKIDATKHAEFTALIAATRHTELECAKYLHYAVDLLLPTAPIKSGYTQEDRNYFGSTDFILDATIKNGVGSEVDCVYIWELKSPQTFLFEFDDNKNRCRPTHELIKAENQLLHYAHAARGDEGFRLRFKVLDRRNIKVGGIIIGRSHDRMLKGAASDDDKRKALHCLSVREEFFYFQNNIRILTWDNVASFLK